MSPAVPPALQLLLGLLGHEDRQLTFEVTKAGLLLTVA